MALINEFKERVLRTRSLNHRIFILSLFLCIAGFFCVPFNSLCEVLNVPSDYSTIQSAIDASSDGDEIIVSQGTYKENIQFKGKNINLRSSDPADTNTVSLTIIDGNTTGSVVTFAGTELTTCVLQGFTIKNGKGDYGGGICGGIYPTYSKATIKNNTISGNWAYYGGGIYYFAGAILNNTITGNSGKNGGGLFNCSGMIRNNTISGNSASSGGGLDRCNGTIQNNTISGNSAQVGGGIYSCFSTIQNNTISGNSAVYSGGGLSLCTKMIQNNMIIENSASHGGGLDNCGSSILNNMISRNSAKYGGGLSSCYGVIRSNTIIGNTSPEGSGLFGCAGLALNCIIWGNSASNGSQFSESRVPLYSCIQDWSGGGEGNISSDPKFVDAANKDFHLADDSPCIDAGNPDVEYNDGCLPPGKGTVRNDMGVYGGPNNCGWITQIMLQDIVNHINGVKILTEPGALSAADANKDGKIDIADIVYLIKNNR